MLPQPEIDFRRTPVTLIIAAVAVALEVVCFLDPDRRAFYQADWKMGILSLVWSGELWRPFTTTLLHGSLIHAAFNVYWLVTFGRVLEPFFGSARYLLVIFLLACCSVMASFLVSNLNTPLDAQRGSVGLSGVIYGLFGFLWVGQRFRASFFEVCGPDVVKLMIAWFFFCIVATYLGILPIDNVAHGVGCALGALYAQAVFETNRRWLWRSAAVFVTLLGLGSMIAAPGHPLYEQHMDNRRPRQIRIHQIGPSDAPSQGEPSDAETTP